ncbi:MAG: SLC13 family permease, partial [Ardenticatenaceae bacterium]
MTLEIALVFALLVGAAILFATEKLRPDVVAMGVLAALLLSGLIDAETAFGAFSNSAVVILGSVFVLSEGLAQTGFATMVARRILSWSGESERRLVLLLMLAGAGLSAFMHNTGAAAILLPAVLAVAHHTGRSPSRLLFPLSIAILAGGSLTLVGTAPNILVSEALRVRSGAGFGFFAFTPIALPILLALIVVTVLLYDKFLPERAVGTSLVESYKLRDYLTELRVDPESSLVGRRLADFYQAADGTFRLISLIRNDTRVFAPPPSLQLRANDVLMMRGRLDELHEVREKWNLLSEPEANFSTEDLVSEELSLAEVTLAPRSSLAGHTLKSARVHQRYGLTVLAIWRKGAALSRRLTEVELRYGDILLVQATRVALERVQEEHDLLLLQEVRQPLARPRKAPI